MTRLERSPNDIGEVAFSDQLTAFTFKQHEMKSVSCCGLMSHCAQPVSGGIQVKKTFLSRRLPRLKMYSIGCVVRLQRARVIFADGSQYHAFGGQSFIRMVCRICH